MENNTKELSENKSDRINYKKTYKNLERKGEKTQIEKENTSLKTVEKRNKSFIDVGFEALEPKHLENEESKKTWRNRLKKDKKKQYKKNKKK